MLLTETEFNELISNMDDREVTFCYEWIIDHNGARSAKAAGYSKRSAHVQGSRLLNRDNVIKLIDHLKAERVERLKFTADQIVMEIAKVAFNSIEEYMEFTDGNVSLIDMENMTDNALRSIKKVKMTQNANLGKVLEVEVYDKLKALELLGKHVGAFTEKVDVTSGGEKIEQAAPVTIMINHRKPGTKIEVDEN